MVPTAIFFLAAAFLAVALLTLPLFVRALLPSALFGTLLLLRVPSTVLVVGVRPTHAFVVIRVNVPLI